MSLLQSEGAEPQEVAAPVADAAPAPEPAQQGEEVVRPSWLPEKYKTPEDLAKGYSELESKIGQRNEDLRKTVEQEYQQKILENRPASKGDYQLPDYVDETSTDNELLGWWAEHAFDRGYSQDEFEKGIARYRDSVAANVPDYDGEVKKLGDHARERISAASMFANKFFPKESLGAVSRMCETHDGIVAIEAIMEATKDASLSGTGVPVVNVDENKLREMMQDPRYWDPKSRDPGFVSQVDNGFKRLYRG